MKIFFSTVVRNARDDVSGEIVRLDWDSKRVEAREPLFPTDPTVVDPNPRGGRRGGRGVALVGDEVVVATYESLRIYDRDLGFRREASHPLMAGLHEVFSDGGPTIWVSATAIDAAVAIDLPSGEAVRDVWPRDVAAFRERFKVAPNDVDPHADNRGPQHSLRHEQDPNHLHLNALAEWKGDVYALLNRHGAIVNLDRQEVVLQDVGRGSEDDRGLRGSHNLVIEPDGRAIVAGTVGRNLRMYDLADGRTERVIRLADFPWVERVARRYDRWYRLRRRLHKRLHVGASPPRPLFVRGLDKVGDVLFVGVSPAAILAVDAERGTLEDVYQYSKDVEVCVHGLRVLTDGPADGDGAAAS